jgi:hypothetical protein
MLRSSILALSIAGALAIGCGSVTPVAGGKGGAGGTGGTTGMAGASGMLGGGGAGGTSSGAGGTSSGTGGTSSGAGGAVSAGGGGGMGTGARGGVDGTGGTGGSPACYNGLTIGGNAVTEVASAGGDVAQGGAIADGTYDLTSIVIYPPANPGAGSWSTTIKVSGTVMDMVTATDVNPTPSYANYTFTTSGRTLSWTTVCGADRPNRGYTATADQLKIMIGTTNNVWYQVDTYTKR